MTATHSLSASDTSFLTNRRRRKRLAHPVPGWIQPINTSATTHLPTDDDAWEVRIQDYSRLGVGFVSTDRFRVGDQHRVRIGRGPMKRSRAVRIVSCRKQGDSLFFIGAEFVN